MSNIFVGLLLIFLDFDLNVGSSTIGLIPDFLGGIFLMMGMKEMKTESEYFKKNEVFTLVYTIISAVIYAGNLFGLFSEVIYLGWIAGLAATVLVILLSYNIVKGIEDMEIRMQTNLEAKSLFNFWLVIAILNGAALLSYIIPLVVIPVAIASFVMSILFLVKLNTSKKNYQMAKSGNSSSV